LVGGGRNYDFHKTNLNGSNSGKKASLISVDQENELKGEINICKEEVDHLKREIRKFNQVL
jgi:hypothetical protein